MNHPDRETIQGYFFNTEAVLEQREEIRRHLRTCVFCQKVMATFDIPLPNTQVVDQESERDRWAAFPNTYPDPGDKIVSH